MHEAHPSFAEIAAASKRLAQGVVDVGENRLELLMVEVEEARERLLHAFMLALGVAVFGLLAGVAFTIGIVVVFWDRSPLAALAILAAVYGGFALYLHARLDGLRGDWQTFSATLGQLRKDRECLANRLH